MNITINRSLFRFEIQQFFGTKQGLAQTAFILLVLWHSSIKAAAGLYASSADYWSNFILINGFCLDLVLNFMAGNELFYKPKKEGALEALLAAGLRPETVAFTNVAIAVVYNSVMLLVLFLLVAVSLGKAGFTPLHMLSFLVITLVNSAMLVLMSYFSMQTKYGMHITGFSLLLAVNLMLASSMMGFSLEVSFARQFLMAAGSGVLLLGCLQVYRRFDREKVLLS